MQNEPTKLSLSRSQLRVHMCQTRKSDEQEWQSLVVLNGTKIFLNGTNISFLKFICGILDRGVANSFWIHVIQISSRQMYFQDIFSNLWKVKVFFGNRYSLKSNTYFWGTAMLVQDGFLYLIVTKHKLTVWLSFHYCTVGPTKYLYLQSTTVYVSSSELGLSHPLSRQWVCPSPGTQGGWAVGTLACGWGVGGVPIPTTGEKA